VRQLRGALTTISLDLGGGFDALRTEFNERIAELDQRFAEVDERFVEVNEHLAGFDRRFRAFDTRIDKIGAMSSAMSQMTASAAGIRAQNRLATGVGFQNGETAFAFGYQRAVGERAAFTIGAAFSGDDEDSVGVGYGVGF
jgi:hypothetical protein